MTGEPIITLEEIKALYDYYFNKDGHFRIRAYVPSDWKGKRPSAQCLLAFPDAHRLLEIRGGSIEFYLPPETPQARSRLRDLCELEKSAHRAIERLARASEGEHRPREPRRKRRSSQAEVINTRTGRKAK